MKKKNIRSLKKENVYELFDYLKNSIKFHHIGNKIIKKIVIDEDEYSKNHHILSSKMDIEYLL